MARTDVLPVAPAFIKSGLKKMPKRSFRLLPLFKWELKPDLQQWLHV
jgi:hypothetical protein